MPISDVHKRPLPSFKEWLDAHSPGTQSDEFEAFADLTARTQQQPLDNLKPNEAAFARMFMGASIAAVELCNMERLKHDTPAEVVIATMARAFACASMYAVASACKPNTPYRELAKMITEDFRAAAKTAADALMEEN